MSLLHNAFQGDLWEGISLFLSLMGHQTNHKTNIFLYFILTLTKGRTLSAFAW